MISFRTRGNFIDFVLIEDTTLQDEHVLMSLHNTSKAIDWSYDENPLTITFTINEKQYSNIPISSIDFDGTTLTTQAGFETNIEAMFTNLAGGGEGGGSGIEGTTISYTAGQFTKIIPDGINRLSLGDYDTTDPSLQLIQDSNGIFLDSDSISWDFPVAADGYAAFGETSAGYTWLLDKASDRVAIGDIFNNNTNTYVLVQPTAGFIVLGNIDEYTDNAAAVAAGVPTGGLYRTGDFLKIVH